ncbi:hypothetical protein TRSA_08350 [Treponema saccharophilum]|uniref:CHP02436-containing protein n=2 Tax=Treponema saccharophilum TaxID=165 RepID=H7EP14_9SPIR|nr:hypothetical protein TresaDRAFT_0120 [Treponema saccharophilum DSM 2985]BDC95736.1 hypothetical protein TRSA_08350 [Treponema saccharophilum]
MNKMENKSSTVSSQFSTKKGVIQEKSKAFAVRIVKFYKYLCDEKKEFVLSKQVLRSGTSIGANVRESKNAQSKADFISKMSIALKEADETAYWIELLTESEIVKETQVKDLYEENTEIIKILTSIVKSSKLKVIDN